MTHPTSPDHAGKRSDTLPRHSRKPRVSRCIRGSAYVFVWWAARLRTENAPGQRGLNQFEGTCPVLAGQDECLRGR